MGVKPSTPILKDVETLPLPLLCSGCPCQCNPCGEEGLLQVPVLLHLSGCQLRLQHQLHLWRTLLEDDLDLCPDLSRALGQRCCIWMQVLRPLFNSSNQRAPTEAWRHWDHWLDWGFGHGCLRCPGFQPSDDHSGGSRHLLHLRHFSALAQATCSSQRTTNPARGSTMQYLGLGRTPQVTKLLNWWKASSSRLTGRPSGS